MNKSGDENMAHTKITHRLLSLAASTIVVGIMAASAQASANYPGWLKADDVYKVQGKFGNVKRAFKVRVKSKGKSLVVVTPIGSHRLSPKGNAVTFKVYLNKAWAQVTWSKQRARITYKGKTGTAKLTKTNGQRIARKGNFNNS
jgi:hypothetical protein